MYLTNLADILRGAGLSVVEVNGWKTRGHGGMSAARSVVVHHTAGAATGNYPSLNVVTYGRSDLAGPLANLGLGRDGTWYVIAAGLAYHAGAVFDSTYGNSNAIGIEAENTGTGQAWPDVQLDSMARGIAALSEAFGIPVDRVKGHKEICKPIGRKVDPAGIPGDMNGVRSRVSAARNAPVAPATSLNNDEESTVLVPAGTNEHVVIPCAGRPLFLYIYSAFGHKVQVHSMDFVKATNYAKADGDFVPGAGRTNMTFDPDRPGPIEVPFGAVGVVLRYTADHPFTAYVG